MRPTARWLAPLALSLFGCTTVYAVGPADPELKEAFGNSYLQTVASPAPQALVWQCELFSTAEASAHCVASFHEAAAHPDGASAIVEVDRAIAAGPHPRDKFYGYGLRAALHYARGEFDLAAEDVHRAPFPTDSETNILFIDHLKYQLPLHGPEAGEFSVFPPLDESIKLHGGRFAGDYAPGRPLVKDVVDMKRCPRPDRAPGVTPADGKRLQVIEPGKGIRGLAFGVSTPDDVLRVYGCDARIVEGPAHEVVAIQYRLGGTTCALSPDHDRPGEFAFEHGVLARIGVDWRQWNVGLPGGFHLTRGQARKVADAVQAFGLSADVRPLDPKDSFVALVGKQAIDEIRYPTGLSVLALKGTSLKRNVVGFWVSGPAATK